MPTKSPLVPPVDKTVAQHNALINARFSFESRDEQFQEHFVPMTEIIHERTGALRMRK
jgi:hypothetical protein